jgi:hypothetical protein
MLEDDLLKIVLRLDRGVVRTLTTTSRQLESASFEEEVARVIGNGRVDWLSKKMARRFISILVEADEKKRLREQRRYAELPRELGVGVSRGVFQGPTWRKTFGGFDKEVTAEPSFREDLNRKCDPDKDDYIDREAEVGFIQDNLVKIPFGKEGDDRFKYVGNTDMEQWARPVIIQRLVALVDKVRKYFEDKHEVDYVPPMPIQSGYRRLGTTVIGGATAKGTSDDICGKLDSYDEFGHWRGLAADMPTKDWRELDCFNQCGFELPLSVFDNLGRQALLHRPFKNTIDKAHWTMIERKNKYSQIPEYLRMPPK